MKKLFLCIFFLTIYNCSHGNSEGCKIIDKIHEEFISNSIKKYDLSCEGTQASFPKKIESIGAVFGVDKLLTVDESRVLIVNLVKDFQILINNSDKIKPHLSDTPFPADRIDISLSFHDGNKPPPPDVISRVITVRGNIYYRTCDLNKPIFDQGRIKESLEEACEKTGISISLIRSTYSDYDKKRSDIEAKKPEPK